MLIISLFNYRLTEVDCVATEERNLVTLTSRTDSSQQVDTIKCIICQKAPQEKAIGSEKGRKRVQEASWLRDDIVSKRLKAIGNENFLYHVSNAFYKACTMKSQLDRIARKTVKSSVDESINKHGRKSTIAPRPHPSPHSEIYSEKYVICGFVKHQGHHDK